MSDSDKRGGSLDVFGIKPVADAIGHASNKTVDGVGALLSRMCLPAAEEIGQMLRDKVKDWRAKNATQMLTVAQEKIDALPNGETIHAHPRLVHEIVESASWADDPDLQKMWAGLLASSCTEDGKNQDNLLLVRLLGQLTPPEARLLRYSVERTKKIRHQGGWIGPQINRSVSVSVDELKQLTGQKDVHTIDIELDHLRALGLTDGGFDNHSTQADLTATAMAIHLYARAQGWADSLEEYYDLDNAPPKSS